MTCVHPELSRIAFALGLIGLGSACSAEMVIHSNLVMGGGVATLSFEPDEAIRSEIRTAITQPKPKTVRLVLSQVSSRNSETTALDVYVNQRYPKGDDFIHDPHYAGAVAFPGKVDDQPSGFLLDLSPCLARLYRDDPKLLDKPLEITLFAIDTAGNRSGSRADIAIGSVTIAVPGAKK